MFTPGCSINILFWLRYYLLHNHQQLWGPKSSLHVCSLAPVIFSPIAYLLMLRHHQNYMCVNEDGLQTGYVHLGKLHLLPARQPEIGYKSYCYHLKWDESLKHQIKGGYFQSGFLPRYEKHNSHVLSLLYLMMALQPKISFKNSW